MNLIKAISSAAMPCQMFFLVIVTCLFSLRVHSQVRDFASDEHLSPAVRTYLKTLNKGGPGLETLTPVQARQVLVNVQKAYKVDLTGITLSEKIIHSDGFAIKLNIVRPARIKGRLPVFIYIHGGGWVLGDFPTHERLVRDLVVASGFVGVFVNYTRTPDAAFPTQINEVYAATRVGSRSW